MKKIITIATALIGLTFAANAQSASDNATQQVNLNLSDAIAITFTGSGTATGSAVSLPFTTVADYANGVTSTDQQLKVQSNKNFTVTVNTNSPNFSYSGSTSPSPVMHVSGVLGLEVTSNSTGGSIASSFSSSSFSDLSRNAKDLLTNCNSGGNQTFSVKYQATPGFSYPAGTYTVSVVYTATQL